MAQRVYHRFGEGLRAFARDDRAAVTIEFALWFPFFLMIFIWTIDITIVLMRATLFDRALDRAVRDVRLGIPMPFPGDYQGFKNLICSYYPGDIDCDNNLSLALLPVDQGAALPGDVECMDRANRVDPATEENAPDPYDPGGASELMLVRACMYIDSFINLRAFLWMGGGGNGTRPEYRFRGLSAFVNEPR